MNQAESLFSLKKGERGAWPILLEEELRLLDYYEPVLGLPDTIKAEALAVENYRKEVRAQLNSLITGLLPSLADTDKPEPPHDWSRKEI